MRFSDEEMFIVPNDGCIDGKQNKCLVYAIWHTLFYMGHLKVLSDVTISVEIFMLDFEDFLTSKFSNFKELKSLKVGPELGQQSMKELRKAYYSNKFLESGHLQVIFSQFVANSWTITEIDLVLVVLRNEDQLKVYKPKYNDVVIVNHENYHFSGTRSISRDSVETDKSTSRSTDLSDFQTKCAIASLLQEKQIKDDADVARIHQIKYDKELARSIETQEENDRIFAELLAQ